MEARMDLIRHLESLLASHYIVLVQTKSSYPESLEGSGCSSVHSNGGPEVAVVAACRPGVIRCQQYSQKQKSIVCRVEGDALSP